MSLGSFSEDFYPFVWDFTFSPVTSRGLPLPNSTSCTVNSTKCTTVNILFTISYGIPFVSHYNFISSYKFYLCAVLSSLLDNSIFKWFVFIKCHQDLSPKTQRLHKQKVGSVYQRFWKKQLVTYHDTQLFLTLNSMDWRASQKFVLYATITNMPY